MGKVKIIGHSLFCTCFYAHGKVLQAVPGRGSHPGLFSMGLAIMPFARARKPHTWFFSLSGSVALPGFTLMPARSGFAWQPQMLSWHLLRRLVLCHRSPTWFRMLTAHRFLFYFSLVCLPVALQVSILAAQLDVAEGGAPHSQSARVPLSSSSASSC